MHTPLRQVGIVIGENPEELEISASFTIGIERPFNFYLFLLCIFLYE